MQHSVNSNDFGENCVDVLDHFAHDLKSPLSVIKTSAYIIANLAVNADVRISDQAKRISFAIEETNHIIETILKIARLDATHTLNIEAVDIVPFIQSIMDLQQSVAEVKGLQLKTVFHDLASDTVVYFDPDQILNVVNNLICNAIKYTDAGGTILVSVSRQSQDLHLSITDTGCGIPQSSLEKIFQRLHRVPEHSHKVEGSGLGLYIVKSIVTLHSGKIWVESEVGKGSTFYVTLPQK